MVLWKECRTEVETWIGLVLLWRLNLLSVGRGFCVCSSSARAVSGCCTRMCPEDRVSSASLPACQGISPRRFSLFHPQSAVPVDAQFDDGIRLNESCWGPSPAIRSERSLPHDLWFLDTLTQGTENYGAEGSPG